MKYPYFLETDSAYFPAIDHNTLDNEGLVAIGSEVSAIQVIIAYKKGVFPWYSELDPVLWWSPNPRGILFPKKVHISKSMYSILRNNKFSFSINQNFEGVIEACSQPRKKENPDTWLLPEMIETYEQLHDQGHAHSFETYLNDELVGGLYGISIGKYFAGESMFSISSNASKAALIMLCQFCLQNGFPFIDCQIPNSHLKTMGTESIQRSKFLSILSTTIHEKVNTTVWEKREIAFTEAIFNH